MSLFIVIIVAITISNCITVAKSFGFSMPKLYGRNETNHPPNPNNNNSNNYVIQRMLNFVEVLSSMFKVHKVPYRSFIGCIVVASFMATSVDVIQTLQFGEAEDSVVSSIQPRDDTYMRISETHQPLAALRGRVLLLDQGHKTTAAAAATDAVRVFTQITFSAEYDRDLMPHTLQHYLDNGLNPEYMLITVHHGDPTAVEEVAAVVEAVQQFGVKHIQTWYGNFTSQNNCDMRQQHRRDAGVTDCDWIIKVDADEFIRVPGNDMPKFLQVLGSQHFDSVFGNWVDRVADNGEIINVTSTAPLSEQFPIGCRFSRTGNATTTKVVAFRGYLSEFRAGHYLRDTLETCRYPPQLLIDHYKWSWPVFTKLQKRIVYYKSIEGHHWWTESALFLDHIASHGGRIDINRSDLSCENHHVDEDAGPTMGRNQQPVLDSFYREETNYLVCQSTKCPSTVMGLER
jgi:hypothetical protein